MCVWAHEANINTEPRNIQKTMQKDFSSTDSPSCDPQSIATKRNETTTNHTHETNYVTWQIKYGGS